ncbi:hypothetical protein GCM10007301_30680 [Azorhizobium oxalatiphilum]|uniref:Uncharacterized protein n=1 Tax=Azorhizobium oxalatiphilum TaxID=980631 RepID=A0A917C3G8_9HYPH|nr:hypothetical protein GCM10007301_30680 [Azorhizobium oxalatiphilum]
MATRMQVAGDPFEKGIAIHLRRADHRAQTKITVCITHLMPPVAGGSASSKAQAHHATHPHMRNPTKDKSTHARRLRSQLDFYRKTHSTYIDSTQCMPCKQI